MKPCDRAEALARVLREVPISDRNLATIELLLIFSQEIAQSSRHDVAHKLAALAKAIASD